VAEEVEEKRGKKLALCVSTERKLLSRFQALSAALLCNQVLRDVKLCSWVSGLRGVSNEGNVIIFKVPAISSFEASECLHPTA
jgi:hypothetical protein